MNRWAPVDWIVLLLAVCIGFGLVLSAISPLVLGQPISEERSKIIGGAVVAVISVISVYVGARMRLPRDREDRE